MKKTLALIMAAALAGSSLAGCGGKADLCLPEGSDGKAFQAGMLGCAPG